MTDGQVHELSRAIGGLETSVDNLTKMLDEERENAARHRRELREVIAALSGSVRTLADEVAEIKPLAVEYRETRDQARGAARLAKYVWAGLMAISAAVGGFVSWLLNHVPLKVVVIGAMVAGIVVAYAAFADGPGPSAFDPPPHPHSQGGDWIMKGKKRNSAGEWCCGEGDCFMVEPVRMTTQGYFIAVTGETVPFSEAQPSPDGKFWRCKRPDGSRRCFFAPPPLT